MVFPNPLMNYLMQRRERPVQGGPHGMAAQYGQLYGLPQDKTLALNQGLTMTGKPGAQPNQQLGNRPPITQGGQQGGQQPAMMQGINPMAAGLGAAGSALLGGMGPSLNPANQSMGANLAKAYQAGMGGFNQARQQQMLNKLFGQQFRAGEREEAAAKVASAQAAKQKALVDSVRQREKLLPTEQQTMIGGVPLHQLPDASIAKYFEEQAKVPKKTDLQKLAFQIYPNDPAKQASWIRDRKERPATGMTRTAGGEWEYDKKYIKGQEDIAAARGEGMAPKWETKTLADGSQIQVSNFGEKRPAPPIQLTVGQRKVDEKFGGEYAEFIAGGGFADVQKNIGQLEEVIQSLGSGSDTLTGPFMAQLSDTALAIQYPEALKIRQDVEEVVQRNLRLLLGPQFTAKEGEQLLARAYNPKLEEAVNSKRIKRLLNTIKVGFAAKRKAIEYYEEKGTLKGFKGAHGMTKGQIIRMATQSDGSILAAARAAIKNGAPKDAVIKRLIENGLNPEDL